MSSSSRQRSDNPESHIQAKARSQRSIRDVLRPQSSRNATGRCRRSRTGRAEMESSDGQVLCSSEPQLVPTPAGPCSGIPRVSVSIPSAPAHSRSPPPVSRRMSPARLDASAGASASHPDLIEVRVEHQDAFQGLCYRRREGDQSQILDHPYPRNVSAALGPCQEIAANRMIQPCSRTQSMAIAAAEYLIARPDSSGAEGLDITRNRWLEPTHRRETFHDHMIRCAPG